MMNKVLIPLMAKVRIGHIIEAQMAEHLGVNIIDESEYAGEAKAKHILKNGFRAPFMTIFNQLKNMKTDDAEKVKFLKVAVVRRVPTKPKCIAYLGLLYYVSPDKSNPLRPAYFRKKLQEPMSIPHGEDNYGIARRTLATLDRVILDSDSDFSDSDSKGSYSGKGEGDMDIYDEVLDVDFEMDVDGGGDGNKTDSSNTAVVSLDVPLAVPSRRFTRSKKQHNASHSDRGHHVLPPT
ncbi:hypothetical protein H4218_002709 [Coemansia sp. IMI 209128]|nr:hypothetical protein H4218_002709 [Coemansia sp. IMI 209128]